MQDDENLKGACPQCGMYIYADRTGHYENCPLRWHRTWPKAPGYYWAYRKGRDPEILLVKVSLTANRQVVHVAGGLVLSPIEGQPVFWRKAEIPLIPTPGQLEEAT